VLAWVALLALPQSALAFDKVDQLQPVAAGRGYVYFIREADALKAPLAGRSVSIAVGKVPGPGATVAPADATGHAVGPAGATATQASGEDGRVYFLLRTSTTPGVNEFTWKDPQYSGQVLVTGTGASPSAAAAGAGAGGAGAKGGTGAAGGAAGSSRAPGTAPKSPSHGGLPPPIAGLIAAALCWLLAPRLLRRRLTAVAAPEEVPSLAARLPAITAPPR
jgi:hypothetical protein